MADLRIAVVGDSAMWGQGLVEANKYWLIATGMIRQRLGSSLIFVDNIIKAHSGAKISATKDDRAGFIDIYPEFLSKQEKVNFLDPDAEGGEEPAGHMFGDIPRTFPTITYQVKSISQQQGDRVNILFMNGGANDLDFEAFLNPGDHKKDFRKTYDSVFKEIFYNKFKALVRLARQKCPNAVIVITGYFSPFWGGDFDGIKQMIIDLKDLSGFDLAANWVANKLGIQIGDLGTDIRGEINKIRERSRFGSALGLYWMRKVVAELNEEPAVRGPGLIFVPAGFRSENGVFAGKPFFHNHYEADQVDDRLKVQRIKSYPRVDHINKMRILGRNITSYFSAIAANQSQNEQDHVPINQLNNMEQEIIRASKELLAVLKGPRKLIDALNTVVGDVTHSVNQQEFLQDLGGTQQELKHEVDRFNHVEIASFLHPNEAGAQHYADNILARFDRHHQTTVREDFVKLAKSLNKGQKPSVVSMKDCLKRYGLDPSVGLRACMQHMIVDSLAVQITTRDDSEDIQVVVELGIDPNSQNSFDLTYLRNVDRVFRPGGTDLIPLDTFGTLHLSMIKQLRLQVQLGAEGFPTWKPSDLTLMINGKEVFKTPIFTTLNLDTPEVLSYPR